MKTSSFLMFLLLSVQFVFGKSLAETGETNKRISSIKVLKNSTDKSLKRGESLFEFNFIDSAKQPIVTNINASVNGKLINFISDAKGKYSFKCSKGKYKFQFYIPGYYEIYSDSIEIKDQFKQELEVTFDAAHMEVIADKPVIYLYPNKETKINITLKPESGFTFTYPTYVNGWSIIATPEGLIKQGNRTYPYLFWEGNWDLHPGDLDFDEGYVIDKKDIVSFLETQLFSFGLNDKEVTDYVTYWVPRMNANEKNFIRFFFNEEYNKMASINVQPKPESSLRIFMVWMNAEEMKGKAPKAQVIPQMQRNGFTLVEWGGSEIKLVEN